MNYFRENRDFGFYKNPIYLSVFFLFAVVQMILTSAPLYGYSSLLVILKDMGAYQRYCVFNETAHTVNSTKTEFNHFKTGCIAQDKAFNLPFALGITVNTVVKVVIGAILDYTGAKTCQFLGCIFMMLFGISLAYLQPGQEYLLFISLTLLSISSSFLMLCPYQVVNILYKRHKSLFMSVLSGSVDGSTIIFIIFLEIYQKGISLSYIASFYGAITTIFVTCACLFLYPSKQTLLALVDEDVRMNITPSPDNPVRFHAEDFAASVCSSYRMYIDSIQRSLDEIEEVEKREALLASLSQSLALQWSQTPIQSGIWQDNKFTPSVNEKPYGTITENVAGFDEDCYNATTSYFNKEEQDEKQKLIINNSQKNAQVTPYAGLPLWRYAFSPLNLVYVYATSLYMLKIVYFIANLDKYLLEITDMETATLYIKYFGYIQFGGVLMGPVCSLFFIGKTREKNGNALNAEEEFLEKVKIMTLPSVVIVLLLLAMTGLQMANNLKLSIPIFILFLTTNGLMWCYITLYLSYLFPAKYYCTLLGIDMGLQGIFSFSQYLLLTIEKDYFEGKQFYTNAIFLVLIGSASVLPLYLIYFHKTFVRGNVTVERAEEYEDGNLL